MNEIQSIDLSEQGASLDKSSALFQMEFSSSRMTA
jgi:hypothetical protein